MKLSKKLLKMTTNSISNELKLQAAKLLSTASFDYEHCGDKIKSGDMQEYINELEDRISEEACLKAINYRENHIIETANSEDITIDAEFIAGYIADEVAQSLVNCVYQTVTFIPNFK